MLRVNDYQVLCDALKSQLDLEGSIICSTEEQALRRLKDMTGIFLVAVIPSTDFRGKQDQYIEQNETLFYIVVKEARGQSVADELQQYQDTQDKIIQLKEYLFGDNSGYCLQFPRLDINSVEIDPEYNIFGGWLGWSIKFRF